MAKPKLLVVLGAGSSIGQGISSVSDVNREMRNWAADWARVYSPATNFFERLWVNAESCFNLEPKVELRKKPNFEKVLGDLVAFSNWMRPHPYGETLRHLITPGNPSPSPPGFVFDMPGIRITPGTRVEHTLVAAQCANLLCRLAGHMRQKSRCLSTVTTAFAMYRKLFEIFQKTFDVGIYNLNYDTVALTANPGMFYGFNAAGVLVPRDVHEREEWGFAGAPPARKLHRGKAARFTKFRPHFGPSGPAIHSLGAACSERGVVGPI